eukprot:CAMPEP_0172162058 /NCGR_PEP_ID=MMETSP1050-20130122/6458_1 /TAXON_ID=233186 /ORGANISM="Cryptomonas curvata, Strain CCAP979/52" /LENGTH=46 /DNA_ID= /DNA_START= /DNA_END= /DNA_ORIENTATION=
MGPRPSPEEARRADGAAATLLAPGTSPSSLSSPAEASRADDTSAAL